MIKPISRQLHGLITDYPYVALVGSAPETVGFKDEKTAVALCRALAGGILTSSLLTRRMGTRFGNLLQNSFGA